MATESNGDDVFVALPDSYDDGISILSWVFTHFSKDKTKILITHIITSPFKGLIEREKTDLVLSKYLSLCAAQKFRAVKLVHMSDDVAEGILHLIAQNGINNLVMRAAPNIEMTEIVSETVNKVRNEANPSCKMWFVYDGNLIFTREAYTYWLTSPTVQPNQPSTSSSTSSRLNTDSPFEASDIVVDATALKEMLNEASLEAINFQKRADEENKRREKVETEMFGAYKKSMFLMTKVVEALQMKEQHVRDIEQILKREKQEKDSMMRDIEELKQAEGNLRNEIEKVKTENDTIKLQRDKYFNQIQAANEKILSLQRQISDFEIVVNDLKVVSASCGVDSLQSDYSKLLQERDDAFKEVEELRKRMEDRDVQFDPSSSEFLFEDLKRATQNFNVELKIGEGGFGSVYKGSLRGTTVAIKLLDSKSLQGLSQFRQEINVLTKVRHPNLVTLIGACSEASALIYEYLSNGSLEDCLKCANNTPPLTWQVRTRIIGEICLALIFLHSNKPHLVVHGDLKPDNILLDSNLVSKLSDFGISRLLKQSNTDTTAFYRTSNLSGTFAYMDPEFLSTGIQTPKSDIYSLGIIILRLLTSKPPLNISREVQEALRSGTFQTDASAGRWPFEEAKELAKIGLRCCNMERRRRPDMVSVWAVVEPVMKNALRVQFAEEHAPSQFVCPIFQAAKDSAGREADDMRQLESSGGIPSQRTPFKHHRPPLAIVLPASTGQGLQISAQLVRHDGQVFYCLLFENNTRVTLNGFMIQFNKNTFGLTAASPLQVPEIEPGSSVKTLLQMNILQNMNTDPPSTILQVVVKNNQQPLWYFNDKFSLHVLFSENGKMERPTFLETWKSLPDNNEVMKDFTNTVIHSIDSTVEHLLASNVFFVTKRRNANKEVLYLSCKIPRGIPFLIEITAGLGVPGVRCAAKTPSPEYASLFFEAIETLLN